MRMREWGGRKNVKVYLHNGQIFYHMYDFAVLMQGFIYYIAILLDTRWHTFFRQKNSNLCDEVKRLYK